MSAPIAAQGAQGIPKAHTLPAEQVSFVPWLTLADAQALIPGSRLVGDGQTLLARVHTDTRTLQAGDLFVALQGERFDAHDFLAQARDAGAAAAVAERGLDALVPAWSGLLVDDSLAALQTLAAAWRAKFSKTGLPVIAVTGSNGKTTVTQMVASILRAWQGEAALATAGNLNNHIGVPMTVLRLRPAQHRVAVIELGMNHPGEIAVLARIAQPTVALVNNAQREHQEFMKTVDAVARENGEALQALPADGVAVFPAADTYAPLWQTLAGERRLMRFALVDDLAASAKLVEPASAEVTATADWQGDAWILSLQSPVGAATLTLRMAGVHNARNALAAAACALAAGCPMDAVVQGLNHFEPVKGRSQLSHLRWQGVDALLVDDSYNANPDSVRAAIDVLAGLPGPRWLLLGDMGEVGDNGPAFHQEVGAYALERGIDVVWTAGALASHTASACGAAVHEDSAAALVQRLAQAVAAGDAPTASAILVKGSRFMKMEQLVAGLREVESATDARERAQAASGASLEASRGAQKDSTC